MDAAYELDDQLAGAGVRPARLVVATGSGGTQAGLCLGAALSGAAYQVTGVTVSRPASECRERIARLAGEAATLIGADGAGLPDVVVVDGLGPGYGVPSPAGDSAADLAARTEGLFLDAVFTAKAMAILVADPGDGPVVFLHTGGTGALADR